MSADTPRPDEGPAPARRGTAHTVTQHSRRASEAQLDVLKWLAIVDEPQTGASMQGEDVGSGSEALKSLDWNAIRKFAAEHEKLMLATRLNSLLSTGGAAAAIELLSALKSGKDLDEESAASSPQPLSADAQKKVIAGQEALARALAGLLKPGVELQLAPSTPKFWADPDHPDILLREIDGKVERVMLSDDGFTPVS